MRPCRGNEKRPAESVGPAEPGAVTGVCSPGPLEWFSHMIENCYEYAVAAKAQGRPVVGIMCEYAPRELLLAAGAVPVCLCGGHAQTIPAAETDLPANLCPLIKSTYGYHVLRQNPFLEMADLIVAETTCDGKKKMLELLARSRPTCVLELPHKSDDAAAFAHWLSELRRFQALIEERFRVRLTPKKLRTAIALMNRERALRRRLAAFLQADAPPLTGRQLLDLKSSISGIPADLEQYQAAIDLLQTSPPLPDAARRVRVLMTGVPLVHGAERVLEIIEDHGGLVVCLETCTGLKPILEDVDPHAPDPLHAIAEKYFRLPCSVRTPNRRRLDSLRNLAQAYRPQCVIDLTWQACLTYAVESFQVREFCREVLLLPCLALETDYSPSDSARLALQVQALFETVRGQADAPPAGSSSKGHA